MESETLTLEKYKRIERCRLRYLSGRPLPRSDLAALGMTARDVLGNCYDPRREPQIEEGN